MADTQDQHQGNVAPDSPPAELTSPLLKIGRFLAGLGLACYVQFFLVGAIGVLRGYSVAGLWPTWTVLVGLGCIAVSGRAMRRGWSWLIIAMLLTPSLGHYLPQGDHAALGTALYEQGRYREALSEFEKETGTWYLRLTYNYKERSAAEGIAKTYCQLEEFDKARDMYKLIIARYPGFWGDGAKEYLDKLENGLAFARDFRGTMPGARGFPGEWYDLGRIYEYDMNCARKALDVYEQIVAMNIREKSKDLARDCAKELRPLVPR